MHLSDLTKTFLLLNNDIMRHRSRRTPRQDVDPVDFYPSYEVPRRCAPRPHQPISYRRSRGICSSILLALVLLGVLAMVLIMAKCKTLLTDLSDICYDENVLHKRVLSDDVPLSSSGVAGVAQAQTGGVAGVTHAPVGEVTAAPQSNVAARPDFERKLTELTKEVAELKHQIELYKTSEPNNTAALCESVIKMVKRENSDYNISKEVDGKIQRALVTYDADKIGKFDHAATYAGGSVVSTPDTIPYPINQTVEVLGMFTIRVWSKPDLILQPSSLPGECFIFHGTEGKILIRLGSAVRLSSVTLEHVPGLLVRDQSCAPRDFVVLGLAEAEGSGDILGKFTYDAGKKQALQTFEIAAESKEEYPFVMLHVLGNHGNKAYTCVYRFRVHSRS